MRTKNLRHWMGICLLAAFLFSFIFTLFPAQKASATHRIDHGTLMWIDATTIRFGDINLIDMEPGDGDMDFTTNGNQSGCFSTIDGFSGGPLGDGTDKSRAHFTIRQRNGLSGDCEVVDEGDVRILETQNANVWFNWVDSANIEPVFDDFRKCGNSALCDENQEDFDNLGGVWVQVRGQNQTMFGPDISGCKRLTFVPDDNNRGGDLQIRNTACTIYDTFHVTIGNVASATAPAGSGTPTGGGGGGSEEGQPPEDSCESAGALGWIMCPVVNAIDGALNWVDTQIQALLEIDSNYYDNPQMRTAFNIIRNIAYTILVPIVLVMVISTALGFDFISAYTVKRALPRLVVAVIFIALSYEICVFLIQLFNELGSATLGIITSPFAAGTADLNLKTLFAGGFVQGIVTGIIAIPGLIIAIWLFGGSLLLFAATAFLVLLLRQIFIVVFLLAAPLAILAWIFPGNDKLWKIWWSAFSKLLIMYPLIMAIIAVGRIFAFTIHNNGAAGLEGAILKPVMTLIAYMIPYAFIPFTFKFAGGIFATLSGRIQDGTQGMSAKQKEKRAQKLQSAADRAKSSNVFKGAPEGSRREKWNRRIGMAANVKKAGFRPSMMRGNLEGAIADERLERAMEQSEKAVGARAFFANDDIMMSALEGEGDINKTRDALARHGFTGRSQDIALGQIQRLRKEMGTEGMNLAMLTKLPATGTAFVGDDIGKWHEAIAKQTRGNRSLQGSIVAAGKAGFRSAQRYEASEAGFGDHMGAIGMAERGESTQAITDTIVDRAYANGGPSAVIGARNAASAEQFSKAINRSVDRAKTNAAAVALDPGATDQERAVAQRAVKQQLAAVSSIHDQIGQAKQTVGQTIANEVFAREGEVTVNVPGPTGIVTRVVRSGRTQFQEVEASRGDAEFRELHKEYGQSEEEARRRGTPPGTPGEGFTPPAPGAGGPGTG